MMELSVWEQGEQIGTVTAQQDGLFYIFICKISQHAEQLRRIYVISKWRVEYLGIPYPRREGAELQACIPVSHFPDGLTAAAAAAMPRGAWLPWCGEAAGVPIRNGLLKQLEDGYALALLPEEAQQVWLEERISAGHTRDILSIPTKEGRQKLTDKLVAEKLTVREAEAIARLFSGKRNDAPTKKEPLPKTFKTVAKALKDVLHTPVKVKSSNGKNKIEIEFQDEEDLERLFEELIAAAS